MILRDIYPGFYRLPANHRSVYCLMCTLENLGVEPRIASAAIDCVLGELPGEEAPIDYHDDEWAPMPEPHQPTDEDWLDYVMWSDRLDRSGWRFEDASHGGARGGIA